VINTFKLKFGRAPGVAPEPISATAVTVFVGPNNSGKSKVLREIEEFCRSGQKNASVVILDELNFSGLTHDEASKTIARLAVVPDHGSKLQDGHILIGSKYGRHQVHPTSLTVIMGNTSLSIGSFCQYFLTHSTLMLNGPNRITLINPQSAGDLQRTPETSLQVLFLERSKRLQVRRIIFDAFRSFFVIDPTSLGALRIRFSQREPASDIEEQGLHEEARRFHAQAQLIDEFSDGVKAFTGIIMEVIAGDPRVLLIDEPEAFLHPSLSFKLGFEVSRAAQSENKRVFASTHSPQFVMGCIQSGAQVNIIRLTYRNNVATARLLPSDELLRLMRHPLLRSTGVISGLFYEFVVVTEGDSDRAFYQEVNERLLRFKREWGIPHCLFINAQNKQTIHTLMRPLRKLGIPAAAIVDVDVLKDGGCNWTNLLSGANVPAMTRDSLASLRAALDKAMDATCKDMKRNGGLAILADADKEAAENLLKQLADYGIFVLPGGELEAWLKPLGASGDKSRWLISVFEKMGEDPDSSTYLKPAEDDVWAFISKIRKWLIDQNRRGIPA
jgi:ABC-type cobalamin/Fe3+-siderophores transport system ATPase subunit